MQKSIRKLTEEDYFLYRQVDTGLESDYMLDVFPRISSGNNVLYGLFLGEELVSTAGYTIYEEQYAMLGRLRSDRRYRGKNLAEEIMGYAKKEAMKIPDVRWVGGNTETKNFPARRVMEKNGLKQWETFHIITSPNAGAVEEENELWHPVTDIQKKQEWIKKMYLQEDSIFPYECYYPFPASSGLFHEENLQKWKFFENSAGTRFLITKYDLKKYNYLHVIYPWNDYDQQPGLWETVHRAHVNLNMQLEEEAFIWLELTEEELAAFPRKPPFTLTSQWTLYGQEIR